MAHNTTSARVRGHVQDMLAVETELHEALRRQKNDAHLREVPQAHRLICRIEATIDRHLSALRSAVSRFGEEESIVKKAVGGVMGAVAGMYANLRSDTSAARALRDDYAALSFATICYEMLHTTALAVGDKETAEMALKHLAEYAPLIMAASEEMPAIVIDELAAEGDVAADPDIAVLAAKNTRGAWASAESAA